MRILRLLTVLTVTPFTNAVSQQQPATNDGSHRSGAFFGVGLTYGQTSGLAFTYQSDGLHTHTLNVRVGGTISPHFRIGGEVDLGIWVSRSDPYGMAALALVGTIYPVASAGFFVKAGIGAHHYNEWIVDYGDAVTALTGVAGVGYDFLHSGGRFSFTPFLQIAVGLTNPTTDQYSGEESKIRLWQVGLSVTWH